MGFASQHFCYAADTLASSLHALLKSLSHDPVANTLPYFIDHLLTWKVTSISEWQSGCSELPPSPEHHPIACPPSACRCSATNLCGPYLVVDISRACGCLQSLQIRVNAYSERFVFLDGESSFFIESSEDWSCADDSSTGSSTDLTESVSSASLNITPSSGSRAPSGELFLKSFHFSPTSKRFSLVDLALLLNAIQKEHVDHRWTDSYADRSLTEFTSAEMFAFFDYFFERDWRNQVLEYRRSIAKRFFDRRVAALNTWISTSANVWNGDENQTSEQKNELDLDHERRLLLCMKDRVSFVNDELRLIWMSLAAQNCALQASKMYLCE